MCFGLFVLWVIASLFSLDGQTMRKISILRSSSGIIQRMPVNLRLDTFTSNRFSLGIMSRFGRVGA